ncbi:family 20 glycosylhydrolase [Paucilactobacillus suebicus]|uniref:N-acetyl-beta-hexosaminidase n=1 Tax=Paucilactobacillus suebicus DSM 5007 = KCTC 3549 TaxID=1423807 RepID=A0A0R1W419_9LACO|nr:family 20 glycosylhydrolase [Paucilactobacillus suebicus]KRM12290.1 N-acetyl-beta-hexosaminidase [Paucilactobacillus suebicus DSM 5007 = KCTC 3549]
MGHKKTKLLSVVIIFLLTCICINTIAKASTQSVNFNGVTLDVARQHYSTATLRQFIDIIHQDNGQFLQLHLTDSNDFGIENSLVGQTKSRAQFHDGTWENKKTKQKFYSLNQMNNLVNYAKKKNVTIIPEVDTPAHVGGLIKDMQAENMNKTVTNISYNNSYYGREIKLNSTGANFVIHLDQMVAKPFINQNNARFHLGGDEFSNSNKPNSAYVYYLNTTSKAISKMNMIPEAWNDGFLNSEVNQINKNIHITYWNWTGDETGKAANQRRKSRASLPTLLKSGYKVLNYNDYYLYFILNKTNLKTKNIKYMSSDMKSNWNPKMWNNDNTSHIKNITNIEGSSVSIWGDPSHTFPQKQVLNSSTKFINTFFKICNEFTQKNN